jgi:predicted metal-dependent peptidase
LNLDWKLTTSTTGGTSFQAPLDWVEKNLNDEVSAFLFFTDGHETMPKPPPYADQFMWIISNDPTGTAKPTFGERMDVTGIDF